MLAAALLASLAAWCPANLATEVRAQPPAAAQQLITVHAPTARSTRGTLRIWRRADGCWRLAGGPYPARLGVNGVRANRREGDGTTPGRHVPDRPDDVRRLGEPGRALPLRPPPLRRLVGRGPALAVLQHVPPRRPADRSRRSARPRRTCTSDPRAYAHLAVIEFNMRPVVPGRGSGIFLHAMKDGPTAGCVSLALPHLRTVLRWLRPGASPHIAIGTRAQLRS